MNEKTIFDLAITQGIWAVLFVSLLFYVLRENSKREAKYQDVISSLSDSFECLKDNFCELKDDFKKAFSGAGGVVHVRSNTKVH